MPIVCSIRRQRRSITVTCIAEGTASGRLAMSSSSRSLFPKRTAGSDATRLDTTMLVFTGSRVTRE
jgi:hypothetical protein